MGEAERQGTDDVGTRDPEEIREDIEQTREDLGETVAAVADKADVKKQARAKVDETKQQAKAKVTDLRDSATQAGQRAGEKVQAATPESAAASAQQASQQAARMARENPVHAAAAGAFIAGLLIGLWMRRG